MPAKRAPAKKPQVKKTAKRTPRADRWCLFATYIGEKQFQRGERVRLRQLGKGAAHVECIGLRKAKPTRSWHGKYSLQWVKTEDLADFQLKRDSNGRKRADVEPELIALLQAAELANKSKK
jgi:hypothetical protein